MSPKRISELEKERRRRELLKAAVTVWFTWVFLIVLYYALPIHSRTDITAYVRLGVSGTVFALVIAWQTRRIVKAELPELRAIEALAVAVALFLIFFSTVYLSLASASSRNFSEDLNHTKALYFTITVFSTVGFGDITPAKDPARVMVAIQMLLDLVLLGVGIRMLLNVAKHGLLETAEEAEAEQS